MSDQPIKVHVIVACCNNNGIGSGGQLPWNLKNEFKHFERMVIGNPPNGKQNVIIIGRRSFESFPPSSIALKHTFIIVVSKTLKKATDKPLPHVIVSSFDEAIILLQSDHWKKKTHEIFNAGGTALYKVCMDSIYCGRIYLTRINHKFDCDTFFPPIDNQFLQIPTEKFPFIPQGIQEENQIQWTVEVYDKVW